MNWAVAPEENARRERVRIKLFTTMLTTYGYAILAGSFWQPLASGQFDASNIGLAAFGLATHIGALYLAPRGEQ